MSFTKDTNRVTVTHSPNLEDYWQIYPELIPETFMPNAREWDTRFPPIFNAIFPEIQAPAWHFSWDIDINPIGMARFAAPNGNTHFVTAGAKKETFTCRMVKEGFWVNTWDLQYGSRLLSNYIPRRTGQVVDGIKARREYTMMQAALGNNWNGQVNTRMQAWNALSWQNTNSTPLGDVLRSQLDVYRMCAKRPSYLFLAYLDWNALHNHPAVLNQLIYTRGNILTDGFVDTLKSLQIKIVEGFYKEDSSESTREGSPGVGDVREIASLTDKHWFLEDTSLITTSNVGNLARIKGENTSLSTISWIDHDRDQILYKIIDAWVPIIYDYARIGRIDFVDDANLVNLYTTQGAEGFWSG